MKLFIWHQNVLQDWTDGIAFAMAHDVHEARRLILEHSKRDLDVVQRLSKEIERAPDIETAGPYGFWEIGGA